MCAAPGGKAILTSCLEDVEITAMDNSSRRIEKLKENLKRCKIKNVSSVVGDGRDSVKIFGKEQFDAVMLDAPCSSLGVIQRHPEIRWRVTNESFASIQILQKQLLSAAVEVIKPGGYILYSVCTFTDEETEEVVDIFLSENKNMTCIKKELTLPGEKNMCGGFFALMKKN
jgi:16S rRNA (cytosine967-C5)-methyltransferase